MRVAVFAGSKTVADNIKTKLTRDARIYVVGAANNNTHILEIAEEMKPDVTIIELRNLDRPTHNELVNLVGDLRNTSKKMQFISLTNFGNIHCNNFASSIDIKGFCLYTISGEDLARAVRAVAGGKVFIQKEYDSALRIQAYLEKHYNLRERHIDVLTLMLLGHSNEEISGFLHISYDTVKSHVKTILDKLEAHDRVEAISIVYIDVLSKINKGFAFLGGYAMVIKLTSILNSSAAIHLST